MACKEWVEMLLPVIVALIGSWVSLWIALIGVRNDRKSKKAANIRKQLEEFYYPILFLCKSNTELFNAFKTFKSDDPNFTTLTALLDGEKFTANEQIILEMIIENDKKLSKIIDEKAKYVSSSSIIGILSKAKAHFEIIELAYANKLSGDKERFRHYTYPRELISTLETEMHKLETELGESE